MCMEQDTPKSAPNGQQFELTCQPACLNHSLNIEWILGRCLLANPLKRCLRPSLKNSSRHVYYGGLDVVEGTLKLNACYSDAYGLNFVDGDCYTPAGQVFLEWLLGKTHIFEQRKQCRCSIYSPPNGALGIFKLSPSPKTKKANPGDGINRYSPSKGVSKNCSRFGYKVGRRGIGMSD